MAARLSPITARRAACASTRLRVEALEDRLMPSIFIKIDYSHDTSGFFTNHTDRETLLQFAANSLASRLDDSLSAIVPTASNTWTAVFNDPATGNDVQIPGPTIGANTILVFAAGRSLGAGELGRGGFGGFSASGTQAWLNTVESRGQSGALSAPGSQTDFGPWGGSVAFDTGFTGWFFGVNPQGITANQVDFFSVAEHELGHLLGFGTGNSWHNRVSGNVFTGPAAVQDFGGNVPVDGTGPAAAHWANGTLDHGLHATMDPIAANGQRTAFTNLDFAGLQDLGWQVTKSINIRKGTSPQSAHINTAFATPLSVQILDFDAKPAPNVAVTFVAPTTGPSGTFAGGAKTVTVLTNSAGVATAPTFTANGTAGSYTVVVSARGLTVTKRFALTNTAPTAALASALPIGAAHPTAAAILYSISSNNGNLKSVGNPDTRELTWNTLQVSRAAGGRKSIGSLHGAKTLTDMTGDEFASMDAWYVTAGPHLT
jgi:hypothetical protein